MWHEIQDLLGFLCDKNTPIQIIRHEKAPIVFKKISENFQHLLCKLWMLKGSWEQNNSLFCEKSWKIIDNME